MTGRRVAVPGNLRQTDLGYLARKLDKINNVDCYNSTFKKKKAGISSQSCFIYIKHKKTKHKKEQKTNNFIRFPGVVSAGIPGKLLLATLLDTLH